MKNNIYKGDVWLLLSFTDSAKHMSRCMMIDPAKVGKRGMWRSSMWSCVAVSGRFTLRHSVSGVVSATLRSAPYCVHNIVHTVHQEREK